MEYTVLKGTHDIINNEAYNYSYIENLLSNIARIYNFKEFRTPIIEKTSLFVRSVGESSDVVRKEMYSFLDKGEREITLRPEFTAGIIRSIVNNKLLFNDVPVKAFYCGPVFRYERPQLGRYRQFNQFGIEIVGSNSYLREVECIVFGYNALKMLGFKDVRLVINTLGDANSRKLYKEKLVEYFSKHIDEMCADCHERLEINPLRILDCKNEDDQHIIFNAPKISDFLSKESNERFQNILNCLDILGVEYTVDERLVRGLDYYSETVFEYHYTSEKSINYGAIGGGGFYNNLVKEIGGPDVSGVGLSFGIERLFNILKDNNLLAKDDGLDVYIIPIGNISNQYLSVLFTTIRDYGFSCDINLESSSFSSSFKKAERNNAKFAIIVGEEEVNTHILTVKNIATKEQFKVVENDLISFLDKNLEDHNDHCHE